MNIEATKLELIKWIADEQSKSLLEQVQQFYQQAQKGKKTANGKGVPHQHQAQPEKAPDPGIEADNQEALWQLAAQPMPDSIDLEQLKKEQGYDPERLREVLKNWDYSLFEDQSLEELLNSLTP